MTEIRIQKFNFIRLIYGILIIIVLVSAFLPYYLEHHPPYPPPPETPVWEGYTTEYEGYIALIFGGWVGVALAIISIILLTPERKKKALLFGGIGFLLILISLMIYPSIISLNQVIVNPITFTAGFYLCLIFGIGLIGTNVVAVVSKEGELIFRRVKSTKVKEVKAKPMKRKVLEVEPIEIKQEVVVGTDWEDKQLVEGKTIDFIKTMQFQSKELPFFEIISKTGIKRETLETIVDDMITNHEINARVRDFVIIFKEISKEEREEGLRKIKTGLQQKMSEIDELIRGNRYDEAIANLNNIIASARNFGLIELMKKAQVKLKEVNTLKIEKREELEEQRVKDELQTQLSEIEDLIEDNKLRNAFRELEKVKQIAQEYELSEILKEAEEKIEQCKTLEEEIKRDKEQAKMDKKIQKKLSKIENLIENSKFYDAILKLVEIKELAREYELSELLEKIEEKIDYCKDFQFNIKKKIKKTILNYGTKFARLELMDIVEKSDVKDESQIEQIILEMIKNREIDAEYFSASKSIAFNQKAKEIAPVSPLEDIKNQRVFLSYSTLDAEHFRISDIVKELEVYPEIKKVSYWQADSKQNIVEFMEDTLKNTDIFVLFCSKNSVKSNAVKDEWQAAFQMRKKGMLKIIPVYDNEDDIPVLLWQMLNVKYTENDFEGFIEKLYEEILRGLQKKVSPTA
ncbi:MAG: TIR domain-containing protein [Promethearchaeota archaeon]